MSRLLFPTPMHLWVKAGDRVESIQRVQGEVLRVLGGAGVPQVKVKWDNGHVGNVSITTVRRVEEGS